jgi:hypothetical protein
VIGLAVCLTCHRTNQTLQLRCSLMRGRLAGRRGCGRGDCDGERRISWGSWRLYFSLLLCRWDLQICGGGSVIMLQVTQFVVRISF